MKIKILYEDPSMLIIDKPSGITVHADGRGKEKTITDWVLTNYPKMKGVGEPMTFDEKIIDRPGIVHRLDKETSGVLVLAKTQKAYEFLKKQFQDREVKKIYHTIVSGYMREDKGVINKPIGRSPSDFRRHLAGRGARGELREALTEYKVLKRFEAPVSSKFSALRPQAGPSGKKNSKIPAREKFTYLEVFPKTGRTHQIRVHMKFLNHPVACDSLYNPGKPCPQGFDRLALHAKSIEIKNPKGKLIKIESPLPKEFKDLL